MALNKKDKKIYKSCTPFIYSGLSTCTHSQTRAISSFESPMLTQRVSMTLNIHSDHVPHEINANIEIPSTWSPKEKKYRHIEPKRK